MWEARARADNAAGNTGFARAIRSFQITRTRDYRRLTDIVLVADNDQRPQWSFDNVCRQIEDVFGAGSAPTNPQTKSKTKPAVSVLMIPWTGICGQLESLCVDAASSADVVSAGRTTDFLATARADQWNNDSRYGKAWLRANLAIRCERDPAVHLAGLFERPRERRLIPLLHASFSRIAGFLARI